MCWYNSYIGLSCSSFLDTITAEHRNWVAKRLSGNDTGLTGGHQVGLYLPRHFFEVVVPQLVTTDELNPHAVLSCYFPRESYSANDIHAIYYNNRFHLFTNGRRGTRDEFRLTNWGGTACPLQNHENTGALVLLTWAEDKILCWVAANLEEETMIENLIGQAIEPGEIVFSDQLAAPIPTDAAIPAIPESWLTQFPSARDIAELAINSVSRTRRTPDALLKERRKIESLVFFEVERLHIEPILQRGFPNVDAFVFFANQITNRRKSRSGLSLEMHLAQIFREWDLQFQEQARTELAKRPDFLFPSEEAYRQAPTQGISLFMLAAKTCCKDRWRQVSSEANKIPDKHLFTLQEGISENQIAEMVEQRVHLVIPEQHRKSFPRSTRDQLLNLATFISTVAETQRH